MKHYIISYVLLYDARYNTNEKFQGLLANKGKAAKEKAPPAETT